MEIMSRLVSKQVLDCFCFLIEEDISHCSFLHISKTGLCHLPWQIWKYPKLWVGFLKCAILTKPQSYGVLLQVGTLLRISYVIYYSYMTRLSFKRKKSNFGS
jgi:hypothetical protein